MSQNTLNRWARSMFAALFGLSTILATIADVEARGRGGGHGPRMHAHGGGHHAARPRPPGARPGANHARPNRPPANRPAANRPHHKPGKGNQYHHHRADNWHNHYNRRGYYDHYGRWVAGAAIAGATAAVIGSIVYSLPRGCRQFVQAGTRYWECGGVYYRSQYQGSNVTYVVVNRP